MSNDYVFLAKKLHCFQCRGCWHCISQWHGSIHHCTGGWCLNIISGGLQYKSLLRVQPWGWILDVQYRKKAPHLMSSFQAHFALLTGILGEWVRYSRSAGSSPDVHKEKSWRESAKYKSVRFTLMCWLQYILIAPHIHFTAWEWCSSPDPLLGREGNMHISQYVKLLIWAMVKETLAG